MKQNYPSHINFTKSSGSKVATMNNMFSLLFFTLPLPTPTESSPAKRFNGGGGGLFGSSPEKSWGGGGGGESLRGWHLIPERQLFVVLK